MVDLELMLGTLGVKQGYIQQGNASLVQGNMHTHTLISSFIPGGQ